MRGDGHQGGRARACVEALLRLLLPPVLEGVVTMSKERSIVFDAAIREAIAPHLPEGALLSEWLLVYEYAVPDEDEQVAIDYAKSETNTLWKALGMIGVIAEAIKQRVWEQ